MIWWRQARGSHGRIPWWKKFGGNRTRERKFWEKWSPPFTSGGGYEAKKEEISRPIAGFHPTVWGDYFITHSPPTQKKSEREMKKRAEELVSQVKEKLQAMISGGSHDVLQEMHLIDAIQRLGLSYHFEKEIDAILSRINTIDPSTGIPVADGSGLHAVSLWFRLLRQHGYRVGAHVFNKFREEDGASCFKASLGGDGRGLLSLYEAAYLGTPGENVLAQAIVFARTQLKSLLVDDHLEAPLATLVSAALETPLIRKMTRLEARRYISVYQDSKDLGDDAVLELAKLDYHLLQLLHWEEVRSITKWMKDLGLMQKLTFVRDRVVELYYWIVGVYYEPRYSRARIMMTKIICLTSIMDDLFDSYGTLEEVINYEDAIQRWELEAAHQLPEYFSDQLVAMINTFKDIEDELTADNKSYRIPYIKNTMKDLARSYLDEIRWREENCVPSMEEHLRVSLISTGYPMLSCASYVGMGEEATKEAFDWVVSFPKIIEGSCLVCRLMDDIVSHEFEQKRGHFASTVECYMKEHCISRKEACEKLKELIEDGWKVINQDCLKPTAVPMSLMMPVVNLTRVVEAIHKYADGYTHSSTFLKDNIAFMLVDPIDL